MKRLLTSLISFLSSLNITFTVIAGLVLTVFAYVLCEKFPGLAAALRPVTEALALQDPGASWWVRLLLVLFGVNLLACTCRRIPYTLRVLKLRPIFGQDALPLQETLTAAGMSPDEAAEKIREALASGCAKPELRRTEGGASLYAEKGRYAFAGFYLSHIGLLLVLMGIAVSGQVKQEYFVMLGQGEQFDTLYIPGVECISAVSPGCAIRLERLEADSDAVENSGDGIVYQSAFSAQRGGETPARASIRGYESFTVLSLRIAQARGSAGKKPCSVRIALAPLQSPDEKRMFTIRQYDTIAIPATGHLINIAALRLDQPAQGKADEVLMVLQVYGPDRKFLYRSPVRFAAHAPYAAAAELQLKDFSLEVTEVTPLDPRTVCTYRVGVEYESYFIWYGISLAITGFAVMFLFSHRKILAVVEPCDTGCRISLAGWDSKRPEPVQAVFEEIKKLASRQAY